MVDLERYRSGSTEPWTASIIAALAVSVRFEHTLRILETGTYQGFTTETIVTAFDSSDVENWQLVSLDNGDASGVPLVWLKQLRNVRLLEADALAWLREYEGEPFNFIFLDDSHNAGHVEEEVDAIINRGLLAPKGLLCMHDVVGPFGLEDIVRKNGGVVLDLKPLHTAGGLGIISNV